MVGILVAAAFAQGVSEQAADTVAVQEPPTESTDSGVGAADAGVAHDDAPDGQPVSEDSVAGPAGVLPDTTPVSDDLPAFAEEDSMAGHSGAAVDSVQTSSSNGDAVRPRGAGSASKSVADSAGPHVDTTTPIGVPSGGYVAGNPFSGGNDGKGEGGLSPLAAATHTRKPSRVKLDVSRGVTFSSVAALPDNLAISGETGFAWNIGMHIPLKRWLRIGVSLRYQQVSFGISHSEVLPNWPMEPDTADSSTADLPAPSIDIDTREELRFLSLPIDIGVRISIRRFSPYLFGAVEPAIFLSGNYLAKETTVAVFEDEAVLTWEKTYDQDVTDDRGRYHLFLGGGIGLEYEYGYGSFYVTGACMVALTELGDTNTMPVRTSSTLITFPVALGLRFGI